MSSHWRATNWFKTKAAIHHQQSFVNSDPKKWSPQWKLMMLSALVNTAPKTNFHLIWYSSASKIPVQMHIHTSYINVKHIHTVSIPFIPLHLSFSSPFFMRLIFVRFNHVYELIWWCIHFNRDSNFSWLNFYFCVYRFAYKVEIRLNHYQFCINGSVGNWPTFYFSKELFLFCSDVKRC